MVNVENESLITHLKSIGYLKSRNVEKALRNVPRENFVPNSVRYMAYRDVPLYIGKDQTISQPATVVAMTEALDVKEGQTILEIGTGSGWQTAILADMVGENGIVYSLEIIPELVKFSKENLEKMKIKNAKVFKGDGSVGLEKHKPYDRIIVTAGSPEIPKELLKQLKPDGILLIPVGNLYLQKLYSVTKKGEKKDLGNFMFVPLKGKHGFK
ncbi:MAG: protein-L-isoaspartate(D-aspartate) O-methyltransferase [Candidatus Aenigmarchaeota archaeon]|nr:protein-L-isoaspartate(D-aspartate) O-methyltransferase [Candidatus Aenigmarchaeota archaeon]